MRYAVRTAQLEDCSLIGHDSLQARYRCSDTSGMSEIVVHWDGNCEGPYSFDIVNRELITRMHGRYGITIATVPRDGEERSPSSHGIPRISPSNVGRGADIVVRHRWPPRFASSRGAYYIHCQPFEYGTIPVAWRDGLRAHADEIWCLSDYVRSTYLAADFAPEMLTVIPNGYDADVFRIDRTEVTPPTNHGTLHLSLRRRRPTT